MEKYKKPLNALNFDEFADIDEMNEKDKERVISEQREFVRSNLNDQLRPCNQWGKVARAFVSIEDKPLSETKPEHIRCGKFDFSLTYSIFTKSGVRSAPYTLRCSFLDNEVFRFNEKEDLIKKAKTNLAMAWLLKWSNLLDIDLEIFKSDTKFIFPVIVYLEKYEKFIRDQMPGISRYYSVLLPPVVAKAGCKAKEEYLINKGLLKPEERMKFDDD